MRVGQISLLLLLAIAAPLPAAAAQPDSLDMCAIESSGYAGDLYDNGWLDKLPGRLKDGTVVCEDQSMRRLGEADGRLYLYWQATFAETVEGYDEAQHHLVAQVGEYASDGSMKVVYRVSSSTEDAIDVHLVERDGALFLALTDPEIRVYRRDPQGFVLLSTGLSLYELPEATVAAALPEGYVASGDHADGIYRATFDPATLSLNLPVAVASEVFPRLYADADYDRPIALRFPAHLDGDNVRVGDPELVEAEDPERGGIGETPAGVSVPADTRMCDIYAWVEDNDPAGVTVRATPDTKGQAIAVLPSAHSGIENDYTSGAELRVVGVREGWFLIEKAEHPTEMYGDDDNAGPGTGSALVRQAYRGRGWIHGSRLATGIQAGQSLRAASDPKSKPVFDLKIDTETGENYATVQGFKSCEGKAIEVTAKRSVDGKEGTGWIGGDDGSQLCSNQVTTCS